MNANTSRDAERLAQIRMLTLRHRWGMILAGISALCTGLLYVVPVFRDLPLYQVPGEGKFAYFVVVGLFFLLLLLLHRVIKVVLLLTAFVYFAVLVRLILLHLQNSFAIPLEEMGGMALIFVAGVTALIGGWIYPAWKPEISRNHEGHHSGRR